MKTMICTGALIPALVLMPVLMLGANALAQDARPEIKTLGIGDIVATKALATNCSRSNQTASLNRLLDSVSEQVESTFQDAKKFQLVSRKDMSQLIAEQQLPPGVLTDEADNKALPGKIKKLDYLLTAKVTDFTDEKVGIPVEGTGQRVDRRTVQATMIIKIFDTSTAAMLQSVRIPVSKEQKGTSLVPSRRLGNAADNDSLIEAVADELATRAASRVIDIVFPARIVGVTDNIVTINRGEGTAVARDQAWEVFALGKDMIDPDTGVSLGREEVKIGEIRITDVLPKFSKGRISGDNRGIDVGNIVRPKAMINPPPDQLPN